MKTLIILTIAFMLAMVVTPTNYVQASDGAGVFVVASNDAPVLLADATTTENTNDAVLVDQPAPKKGIFKNLLSSFSFDIWGIINLLLGAIAFLFAKFWISGRQKLKEAGELLITISDAIEDKNADANERKDIAAKAKKLFSKKE